MVNLAAPAPDPFWDASPTTICWARRAEKQGSLNWLTAPTIVNYELWLNNSAQWCLADTLARSWEFAPILTYSIKTCNALEAGTWPRTKNQIIIRVVTVKGVRKGGVGVNPPWTWYFTKTLSPAQRRLIVFAYFLLVNLSTWCKYHRMNLHANFKEDCKWAKK